MPPIEYRATLLKVDGVSLTFGENLILRDVRCEVKDIVGRGQVVGLLGPSGIGKTQFFRILSGLQQSTAGHVRINATGDPVIIGEIGVVAQHYPLFEHRKVFGNLVLAGRLSGLARRDAEAKATGLLAKLELADRGKFWPRQLSGGQRQRVAIAQQLMQEGHFLLMDEPFSGLDPEAIDTVCELIAYVAGLDEENTVVVVTHDIRAAMKVADQLWLMGLDRNPDGTFVPGARMQECYNLLEQGLAWSPEVSQTTAFDDMYHTVRKRFSTLKPKPKR